MAEHDVRIDGFPEVGIGNADVRFRVDSDGVLLGHLTVSRGGLDWRPANSLLRRLSWEQFVGMIERAWE
jgi:hypothetical protein